MPEERKLTVVAKFPQTDEAKVKGQSAIELLEEFVADVRAGKENLDNGKVFIFWLDEKWRPRMWRKGTSILEQIGYGELIKAMAMEEWRTGD